jgi:hypothetical protein
MSEKQKHPKKPTDLGQDFIKSGMRLITQQSADKYLADMTLMEETVGLDKQAPS